jgi:Haem-binding domain/Cytochrome P460
MKSRLIIIAIVIVVAVAIQFLSAEVKNQPVTGEPNAPEAVMQIYKRACYNCHSNETRLEWYDKIAPASWLVARDVREARSRFNFSQWDKLSDADRSSILWETVNVLVAGKMPLRSYTALHADARVSSADIEILKNYVNSLPNYKPADSAAIVASIVAAEKEFAATQVVGKDRQAGKTVAGPLPVALNGVEYIPGYRQWQVMSTPNRFDNYTVRVLYGNDIAVKALAKNRINPFPDGAAVVKIVWNKIVDSAGTIRPGTFNSAQIMIKDDKKYAKTGGWGFALFAGVKLMPTGKTAAFETTCYNCHKELASETGLVFDVPPTREVFDAGGQEVIAPSVNQREGTVSILYGDTAARRYTLATWEQVDDPHWYGSHINGRLLRVDTGVKVGSNIKPAIFP